MSVIHAITTWLGYWSGVSVESGKGYGFWSGIGSCITEFAMLGGIWHHLNCHASGCWRVARHQVDGTSFKVCRRHHPEVPSGRVSVQHIHAAHAAAKEGK